MTFQEALKKETKWHRKVLIINIYHSKMCLARKKWTVRLTARKLGISFGAVSEAIKLSKAISENGDLEKMTRAQALKVIKNA